MDSARTNELHISDYLEPVAIVGMGCRWPGDLESPSEMWDFLQAKKDAYSKFPSDRIKTESFYHPNRERPGSFYTEGGCFIKSDPRDFDHTFFGIHPREVMSLDPAQRKFLEVVYEAFESGGVPMHKLAGSKTGCFVGNFNYDHQLMQYRDAEYPESYAVTGGGITVLSNRVNYVFDLKGPSMTLDTACSSSMYALHLACSAIQSGDCIAAVVGGSNLILTPECQIFSSVLGAVSPTSVCHTFDASADGYARADGVGALYIKKLSEAVKNGDPIRAVVRGTAINANGRTGGITHPSPEGQEAVIRSAYARAGNLDPSLTGYFECHGTGTAVGDPLEIAAISRIFTDTRSASAPLLIGSIKTNLGHSEPASGIAGIMKAVLAIEHGIIPPSIGLKTLNPNIDLKQGRLKIVIENTDWPNLPIRRASVNSFGYGGANAHAILESIDSILPGCGSSRQVNAYNDASRSFRLDVSNISNHLNAHVNGLASKNLNGYSNGSDNRLSEKHVYSEQRSFFLLPFSAHDEKTLRMNIAALRKKVFNWDLVDVAHTLCLRRSMFSHRAFVVADKRTLHENLEQEKISVVRKQTASVPTIGFVFTGQGAQWPQMGLDLMNEFPSYLKTIRRLDGYLDRLNDGRKWTVEGALRQQADQSRIYEAEISQPLITAVQIALVNLLDDWNIQPVSVVGHSSGEIAASYAAALNSEEDSIIVAYLRGKAVARNTMKGAMIAVGISASEVMPYLANYDGRVIIACFNSPKSVTLSGDANAVAQVKEILDAEKKFTRLLPTNENAYHCHHMKVIGQQYEDEMTEKTLHLARGDSKRKKNLISSPVSFFSSVHGQVHRFELGPQYWRKNLESPVLFDQAVTHLVQTSPVDILIEVGPHSALQAPLRQISETNGSTRQFPDYLSAMVRKNNNVIDLLTLAGDLFRKGHDINLGSVNAIGIKGDSRVQNGRVVTDFPHYQWQYSDEVLFSENRYTREWRLRMHPRHDILGSRIPGGVKAQPTWRNMLRSKDIPWLEDHRLGTDIVFPSTGYLSMAMEAVTQAVEVEDRKAEEIESYEFRDVSLKKALIVPDDDHGVEVLFTLRTMPLNSTTNHENVFEFVLTSVVNENKKDGFIEHCRGKITVSFESHGMIPNALVSEIEAMSEVKKHISASRWYETFARSGLYYGPSFRGLSDIKAVGTGNLVEAKVGLTPTANLMKNESRYVVHPAALDAALQLSILASHASMVTKYKKAFMPVSFQTVKVWPKSARITGGSAQSISKGVLKGVRALSAGVLLLGAQQKPILEANNILLISSDQNLQIFTDKTDPYTRMVWKPEFSSLDDATVTALYPPICLDENAIIPSLNHLALHQLIHFRKTNPEIFKAGSKIPHLQRLLDWTNDKINIASNDHFSAARQILDYSDDYREEEISRLSASLNPRSSESRLMDQLYKNLPEIYSGEKTGIQVALQDNLLLENYESGQVYKEGNRRLASIIALLAHQKSDLKILEIGGGTGSATSEILPALHGSTPWRRYVEYRFTDTTSSFLAGAEDRFRDIGGMTYGTFDMEKPGSTQGYQPEWDVIVASNVIHATTNIVGTLLNIRSVMKPGAKMVLLETTKSHLSAGLVLGTFSDFWKGDNDEEYPRLDGPFLNKSMWRSALSEAGFSGLDFSLDDYAGNNSSATVICASAIEPELPRPENLLSASSGLTFIYRHAPTPFILGLGEHIRSTGIVVDSVSLENVDVIRYSRLLFLLELEAPFLLDVTPTEWDNLQLCIKSATSALWVSNGGLLKGHQPLFAMISGVARGLKTEMGHLRFNILDLDQEPVVPDSNLYNVLLLFQQRASNTVNSDDDTEFRRKDGITYISRLVADNTMNKQLRAKKDQQISTQSTLLKTLRSTPVRLDIDKPGVLSTLHFKEDLDFTLPLADDHVEIEVECAGVNNKDIAVVTGRHHSDTFSDECAGIITKVGATVTDFEPGDRVYCQSFAKFGNFVRDKASFCQKLQPEDSFESVATMPIAFCTAIHALMNLGRLTKGESVLIQSATGAVGIAALQIARICEAEIYVTVGTPEKKAELLNMGFGIPDDHVFWSRDPHSPEYILQHTMAQGVDVVLCSARGALMHEYWRCIATGGRFIEIGRTEILDNGSLSLDVFQRNATFASFDLEVMSNTRPDLIRDLMATLNDLKVRELIKPLPYTTYHASEIDRAFMAFSKGTHIGKILVTYDRDTESGIQIRSSPYGFRFDEQAAYLLVGCLGGLGRSFSRWAVQRGARNLMFLSRTGAAKPEAREFVEMLRSQGVNAKVVKGDVTSLKDVKAAVAASDKPIKGVIQGALTLHDGLFESMTLTKFKSTVNPRVVGTLNLHEALKDSPLDFFEMWSSWTAMFGTATQSNYLSSNAFMDAFARHRQSLGLPATSLALSQILGIGIVSYMPEYQQAMIRNGLYGNDEDEFLQFCEAGICPPPTPEIDMFSHDPNTRGHLLVGIDPAGLEKLDKSHPIKDMVWSQDPRFSHLIQATRLLSQLANGTDSVDSNEAEAGTLVERIKLKISRLLYVPPDEVGIDTAINDYGIDSMIAAELRNWLFGSFGKDISLLNLLGPTMTVRRLADEIDSGSEE